MVKSLSISQVLPYNLSQTIKIIIKINPLPLNQAGEYLTGRQDHHWQGWVGPSSWLLRASWESWVPGHGWACGDSRAEAKVATCGGSGGSSDPTQEGGKGAGRLVWRQAERKGERRQSPFFRYSIFTLKKSQFLFLCFLKNMIKPQRQ